MNTKDTKDTKAKACTVFSFVSLVFIVSFVPAKPAAAQSYELVGTRAQGMAGAFVAVADDATALWWNPAGLATGASFSAILEYNRGGEPAKTQAMGFSAAFPALALAYYRLPLSEIGPVGSTAPGAASRQDQDVLSQFGASVGQSLGDHLVVATTLKLLKAGDTRGDVDVGAMAALGRSRVGLALKNATAPTLAGVALHRQVRAGVAFTTATVGRGSVTIALDGDLTKARTVRGKARHVAGGAEAWTPTRRLGVRGGVSISTTGEARPAVSGGLSVGLNSAMYVDGQLTGSSDRARRNWSLCTRVTF